MLRGRISLVMCALILSNIVGAASARGSQAELVNRPEASDVVRAFSTVRDWLNDFTVPAADSPPAKLKIANSSGVCIVLRRSGRVLGIGTDVVADDLMLRRAAAQAMSQVLSDPALQGMLARIESDNENPDRARDIEQLQRDIGRSISIELEVAGKLSPLIGQSLQGMSSKLDPGVDGAAMRVNQSWQFSFPSQLRSSNANPEPERMLESLVLTSSFPLKDIRTIPQRSDVGLYSFRSITLSQSAPDRQPHQLFRGDTIVPQSAITPESIAQLADGITRHLIESMWPEPAKDDEGTRVNQPQPLGLMGDYQIVSDQYQPLFAPPFEQALAAFALHRYAAVDAVDDATAASAMGCALRILRELAQVTDREVDPLAHPLACAAIVYAVSEMPAMRGDAVVGPLFRNAARRVVACFSDAGTFTVGDLSSNAVSVPPMSQAMLAGAMARLLSLREDSDQRLNAELVRKALDVAWASAPKAQHVDLLPWIGWAEAGFARCTKQPLAHAEDLSLLIELLEHSRIAPEKNGSLDLAGGFALVSAGGGTPRATSQSLRASAWLSSIAGDPLYSEMLKPRTQFDLGRLSAMRFLAQLALREPLAVPLRNPKRAIGGIRQSPWDSTQPVAAQALGLLAATEYLASASTPHKSTKD